MSGDHHVTVTCYRYVLEEKTLEVEIEPGMRDGYQYPFIAEGISSVCLICQTVCRFACLHVCMSCLSIYLPACSSICPSVRPSVCLSVCLSVSGSCIPLFICLCLCLSVFAFMSGIRECVYIMLFPSFRRAPY